MIVLNKDELEGTCRTHERGRYAFKILKGPRHLRDLTLTGKIIMWRIDPLLDNYSVNIFPREPTRATIGRLLLGNGSVNTLKTMRDNRRRYFPWDPPWGYIARSSKGALDCCRELGQVLVMAVEGNWEKNGKNFFWGLQPVACIQFLCSKISR
jgi:hypothetical protein